MNNNSFVPSKERNEFDELQFLPLRNFYLFVFKLASIYSFLNCWKCDEFQLLPNNIFLPSFPRLLNFIFHPFISNNLRGSIIFQDWNNPTDIYPTSKLATTSTSPFNFIRDDLWRMYFKFGNAINSSTSSTMFFIAILRNGNDRLESAGSNLFRPLGRKRETGVISLTRRRRFIVWPPVTKTKRFSHTHTRARARAYRLDDKWRTSVNSACYT